MPFGLDFFFFFQSVIRKSALVINGPTKSLYSVDGVIWISLVSQSVINGI